MQREKKRCAEMEREKNCNKREKIVLFRIKKVNRPNASHV